MRVDVEAPRVRGSRAVYRWAQSRPSDLQHHQVWSIDYPGVDLREASPELLLEVFLTLQLPVLAAAAPAVTVRLPHPLPAAVVDWWREYHDAEHVHVGPVTSAGSYVPFRRRSDAGPGKTAVTFGGGKDSTLTAEAVAADVGAENVVLLHGTHPFSAVRRTVRTGARRSERMILRPYRDRGFTIAPMVTDFLGTLTKGKRGRPGVNLYLAAGLPTLLHHGCTEVTTSHTAGGYLVRRRADGSPSFINAAHRPESLDALAAYYDRVLGVTLQPVSTHFPITEFVSFATLLREFPTGFATIVMCMRETDPSRRWCLDCKKCAEYALFGLALGHVDAQFDYDALFSRSAYVRGLAEHVSRSRADGVTGNVPWTTDVGTRTHISALRHAVALLDPRLVEHRLGPAARQTLEILRDGFGHQEQPAVAVIAAEAAARAVAPSARSVLEAAVRAGAPVVDELPGPLHDGNAVAEYWFGPMP